MGNDVHLTLNPGPAPLMDAFAGRATSAARFPAVHLVRGRESITAMHGMLMDLSRRTGQTGAMDSLDYFLALPSALLKTPYLVLVGLRPGVEPERATADDLQGALLLHEYRYAGIGGAVFVTEDGTGHRTVIAPPELRTHVAEAACRTLLSKGAVMVLISLQSDVEPHRSPAVLAEARSPFWIASRMRMLPSHLVLAETFDDTLSMLGRHTRRNLRYYRRRVEEEFGATFVPQVEISREDFSEMNRTSSNPIPEAALDLRYYWIHKLRRPLFAGVREANGRWLSLIGGRRHEGATEIDWQMNRADLPRYSISTVMRSYLLEAEIAAGTSKLVFEGGTPHSMRLSFVNTSTLDILVRREGLRDRLLRRFADRIFPEKNFLRDTLADPSLEWTRW